MTRKLPDRPRVFISGGGSGLGRALALNLARRGGRILIGEINLDRAGETAEEIEKLGGKAAVVSCDVGKPADVEKAAAKLDSLWGGTDVCINNAGVAASGPVGEVSLQDWQWIMKINLWGVIHGCHSFVPRMKRQGNGWILNVASSAGIATLPEMAPYNVTKAGVIALSETLYTELAPHKIAVSALCPTFFKTNLMDNFRSPVERQRQLAQAMFDRSSMTAEQVAEIALKGLARGQVIIVPQTDGKLIWGAKRLSPNLFYRQAARVYGSSLAERIGIK